MVRRGVDYPSQLNKLLESKYPGRFIVYNRGRPGTTSAKILFSMDRFMEGIKPDIIILLCGANEYNPRLSVIPLGRLSSFWGNLFIAFSGYLQDLKIYKMSVALIDHLRYEARWGCAIRPKKGLCPEFDEGMRALLRERYLENLAAIADKGRVKGAAVVYSTYLWPWVNYQDIKDAAQKNGVVLTDQVEMLKRSGAPISKVMSEDGFHPNVLGYEFMAWSLLRTLEEMPAFLRYTQDR